MTRKLQIDEELSDLGLPVSYALQSAGDLFTLMRGGERLGVLSPRIIADVMRRYARPLEEAPAGASEALPLGGGMHLRTWRYRAPVDLEAKLYLVLEAPDQEPVAVLARQISAALRFLCSRQ